MRTKSRDKGKKVLSRWRPCVYKFVNLPGMFSILYGFIEDISNLVIKLTIKLSM